MVVCEQFAYLQKRFIPSHVTGWFTPSDFDYQYTNNTVSVSVSESDASTEINTFDGFVLKNFKPYPFYLYIKPNRIKFVLKTVLFTLSSKLFSEI
jgi:hypothetical protein